MNSASRRHSFRARGALALLSSLLLVPICVSGAASAQVVPSSPRLAESNATGSADMIAIDLGGLGASEAEALAAQLPEWEEAINAGTRQLLIPAGRLGGLLEAGFEIEVVDAPAQETALPPWPACYHRLDEVYSWLEDFAARNSEIVELLDIGDSWCKTQGGCTTPGGDRIAGRDLLVAKITAEGSISAKEGRFWIDGGIHARELPSVELMKASIEHLVEGYGEDPQISYLLDHRELYVGIATNPDGRLLVELGSSPPYASGPWMWRKNANDSAGADCGWPLRAGHHGIDLNRNQDFKWDAPGHSTNPCAETYRGASPASEPEIQAYEDFLRTIFDDQRGPEDGDAAGLDTSGLMINFHNATWPGTTLVPWGWTTEKSANDAGLWAIGSRYSSFNGYRTQYSLYPVSGNTRDWGYGELGIPAYVVELQGRSFVSPCAELPGIIRQNLDGIEMMLGLADRPYQRIRGPEATRLSVSLLGSAESRRARLRARVTDLRAGKDEIAEARLAIGRVGGLAVGDLPAPGASPEQWLEMQAEDGAFDERSEWVTFDLDVGQLAAGRYYLTVRARDRAQREDGVDGYWGSASAIWLEIDTGAQRSLPSLQFD